MMVYIRRKNKMSWILIQSREREKVGQSELRHRANYRCIPDTLSVSYFITRPETHRNVPIQWKPRINPWNIVPCDFVILRISLKMITNNRKIFSSPQFGHSVCFLFVCLLLFYFHKHHHHLPWKIPSGGGLYIYYCHKRVPRVARRLQSIILAIVSPFTIKHNS